MFGTDFLLFQFFLQSIHPFLCFFSQFAHSSILLEWRPTQCDMPKRNGYVGFGLALPFLVPCCCCYSCVCWLLFLLSSVAWDGCYYVSLLRWWLYDVDECDLELMKIHRFFALVTPTLIFIANSLLTLAARASCCSGNIISATSSANSRVIFPKVDFSFWYKFVQPW